MIRKQLQILNKLGLHARAAAKVVQLTARFESEIQINRNGKTVNAKSIMEVLMLAAPQDAWLELIIDGIDEQEASLQLENLFLSRFGEAK